MTAGHKVGTIHFVAAGALAGFSQGFIGVGGGLVMTSLMTIATDMPQHAIIATTLGATTLINLSATSVHVRLGNVHLRTAAVISAASIGNSALVPIYPVHKT